VDRARIIEAHWGVASWTGGRRRIWSSLAMGPSTSVVRRARISHVHTKVRYTFPCHIPTLLFPDPKTSVHTACSKSLELSCYCLPAAHRELGIRLGNDPELCRPPGSLEATCMPSRTMTLPCSSISNDWLSYVTHKVRRASEQISLHPKVLTAASCLHAQHIHNLLRNSRTLHGWTESKHGSSGAALRAVPTNCHN